MTSTTDPQALRDRIAGALAEADGWQWAPGYDKTQSPTYQQYLRHADVVLAVLPASSGRAALLHEAADAVFALDYDVMVGEEGDENLGSMREAWDVGTIHAEKLLRRMADDAEYVATPCSGPVPCEDGGEPCDVHERLMGHIEGDHELCEPDCGQEQPRRVAAEEQPAETQDGGRVKAIADAIGPNMLFGLQDAELLGEPGQERIRDWIKWISETVAALPVERRPVVGEQPDTQETLCRCGHGRAYHDVEYGGPRCRLCPDHGDGAWAHAFTAAP